MRSYNKLSPWSLLLIKGDMNSKVVSIMTTAKELKGAMAVV